MPHTRHTITLLTLLILLQQELTRVMWCTQVLADSSQYRRQDRIEAIEGRIPRRRLMRVVGVGGRVEYPRE
jgi:hypothetical protein